MFIQTVKDAFQRSLGDFEVPFNRMFPIHEHLRLHDRHYVTFLTKRRIARQRLRVCVNACGCGNFLADRDDGAPFGKARAQLPIFRQPVAQSVETFGDFLARKIRHRLGAFIHFDPGNDPLLLQRFDESATVASFLPNRFVKKNYAADEVSRSLSRKQNFPIRATVLFR